MELPDAIAQHVAAITGAKVTSSRPVGGGYTVALRWVLQLENGTSAFVKYATRAALSFALGGQALGLRHLE